MLVHSSSKSAVVVTFTVERGLSRPTLYQGPRTALSQSCTSFYRPPLWASSPIALDCHFHITNCHPTILIRPPTAPNPTTKRENLPISPWRPAAAWWALAFRPGSSRRPVQGHSAAWRSHQIDDLLGLACLPTIKSATGNESPAAERGSDRISLSDLGGPSDDKSCHSRPLPLSLPRVHESTTTTSPRIIPPPPPRIWYCTL